MDKYLQSIQQTVDNFITPNDVGHIPTRIASGFAGFTADLGLNGCTRADVVSFLLIAPVKTHHHDSCICYYSIKPR